jgi:O-antigen ligase
MEDIMENIGLGAGLVSLAFWGFLSVAVVAGIWDSIRKRDAQHETLRRLLESGQPLDPEMLDKLVSAGSGGQQRLDRAFKLVALYTLPAALGMALFGLIMATQYPQVEAPLLGVAALLACVGAGFWFGSRLVSRWNDEDESSPKHP